MEASRKREGGNFAALFSSDGSLNMAEFCEKISKRYVHFGGNLLHVYPCLWVGEYLQAIFAESVISLFFFLFCREAAFQELNVSTACLALLSGNYLAASKG